MKQWRHLLILSLFIFSFILSRAQCSVCTKTAEQLGEGPASALNNAIVYLMMTPLLIMGFVGFRWWKKEKAVNAFEQQNNN
jgi:hypothetical protein